MVLCVRNLLRISASVYYDKISLSGFNGSVAKSTSSTGVVCVPSGGCQVSKLPSQITLFTNHPFSLSIIA